MLENDEKRAIVRLIERLVMRFPHLPGEVIEHVVTAAHHRFADAPIRDFVPLLVEHDAVDLLWAYAGSAAEPVEGPPAQPAPAVEHV